jgi:hypothetical protein
MRLANNGANIAVATKEEPKCESNLKENVLLGLFLLISVFFIYQSMHPSSRV